MKRKLITLLLALAVNISVTRAQRFDWVSFNPLTSTNVNYASGTLSVTADAAGNVYSVCIFNDAIMAGLDTVYHVGNLGRPDILITKWSTAGEVLNYRHIANWSNNGNPDPQQLLFDETTGEILLTISSYYSGMQVTLMANANQPDSMLSLAPGAVLRFNTDLDFISYKSFPGGTGYTTPSVIKDGFLYSAQGYNSTVSKTDTAGTVLWSVTPSNSFYIHDIAISNNDTIYVIGYSQSGGAVSLDSVSVTTPSAGNFTHSIIFKLDTAGNVLQGIYFVEAAYYTFPLRLTTDSAGNLFVAGSYQLGGQMIGSHTLSTPTGARDGFITKLSSTLQPVWTSEFHHTGGDLSIRDIVVNPSGKIMAIGMYGGNATFGSFPLYNSMYGTSFMVQMESAAGNVLYATEMGALYGTSLPHSICNLGDKYYIGGTSNGVGPNAGSYGCYTHTELCAYVTLFTDTLFQTPTVILQYNAPDLVAAGNTTGASYQWFLNGVELIGETGNTIVPDSSGTYQVMVNSYGCEASDTLTITVVTVGLDNANHELSNLHLHPNPAVNSFTIGNAPTGAIVNILDIRGEKVYSSVVNSAQTTINTTDLVNGIYILQVQLNDRATHRKLVISKN